MSEPIRVLQVVTHMNRGGLETMLMNYYRHMDRTKVQFDFLTHRNDGKKDYDDEILSMGGRIYHVPACNPFSVQYRKALDHFFEEHTEYKIVHSHIDCMSAYPLKYAKKHGVPVRIAHSHNSKQDKNLKYPLKLLAKRYIPTYATTLFACGQEAGDWMFGGKNFKVVNNAIDAQQFAFDVKIRSQVRAQLDIQEGALVLGHVGRFSEVKNHRFLIEIFVNVKKVSPKSVLLLIGTGDLVGEIKELCKQKNVEDAVRFLGVRSDIPQLMQAMDVFVFPSLYEGLPVTLIEAQAAGLPCVISNRVPKECKKTDLIYSLALEDDIGQWVNEIVNVSKINRKNVVSEIKRAGFDIKENVKMLQQFYLRIQNERG